MCFGITVVATNSSVELAIADTITDYYSEITATGGNELLGQVHDLITKTHTTYTSYSDCSNPTYVQRTDPGSSSAYVMEFYSQADISATWGSGNVGTWNREHLWCQSLSNGLWTDVSNSTRSGGSDLYHIRPAESRLNSTRGNNKYGELTNRDNSKVYYKDAGGNNVAHGGYNSGGVFEPLDEVKGDVARILMYVYTHYNTYSNVHGTTNGSASCFGTLNFTHVISASSEAAAISMLLEWNKSDPVDQVEITRNEVVYDIQGNRNPFVDHPEYADAIWGDSAVIPPSAELKSISISPSSITLTEGKSQTFTVTPNPSNASANVTWTSSNEAVASVSASGLVTAKSVGTATITATSTENPSITATAQVTVQKSSYKVATITLDSFELTSGYGFKSWSAGELSGTAWIYGGNAAYPQTNGMQFNKNQPSYYLASTTAASGPIRSVTVMAHTANTADRDWKLLTSDTPYGNVSGKPTNGTDQGTQTVTLSGTTWTVSGEDTYFALTYEYPSSGSSAAAYIDSIIIEYGDASAEHVCGHVCGICSKCLDETCTDPVCAEKCQGHSGGEDQPDIDDIKLQEFHNAVVDIVTDGTLEARLASINKAISAYHALTDAQKVSAEGDIAALLEAIEDYNQTVNSYNEEAKKANNAAGAVRG